MVRVGVGQARVLEKELRRHRVCAYVTSLLTTMPLTSKFPVKDNARSSVKESKADFEL